MTLNKKSLIMKFVPILSFILTIILFNACSKEKIDDSLISYTFNGKDWVAEKSKIDVQLFENVLLVDLNSNNASNSSIRGSMSFAIHNPSLGTFDLTNENKHGFKYCNLTDLPDLITFTLADQKGKITIHELDYQAKTISFTVEVTLRSKDVKNQSINFKVVTAPMKIKSQKVSYLRYLTEQIDSDVHDFGIDTLRTNTPGKFSFFNWAGYLSCYYNQPIDLISYTEKDDSPYFGFSNYYLSNLTAHEYELKVLSADSSGISASFQATIFYPNFGETSNFKNGYFEMFIEK